MRHAHESLAQLTADLRLMPQRLVNVRLRPGIDWKEHAALAREKAAVEKQLAGRGRVLIRPSGTEPVLRLMVEADDAALADRLAHRLAESLAGSGS
jgi:phosphoglucosamine mutase